MRLGLVGLGFVGEAFLEGMRSHYIIETFDIVKPCTCTTIQELVERTGAIFIAVPTPMLPNGRCDTSIVVSVVQEIQAIDPHKIIVVKSTVPPYSLHKVNEHRTLVFNPEFLTEANYINDFKNQDRIILGGSDMALQVVARIYKKVFPTVPIYETDINTAIMIKYATNTFLSMKVAFANEIWQICDYVGLDYPAVVQGLLLDTRLGKTHWKVPGPDGHFGFGGTCFPKDVNALKSYASSEGVTPTILQAVWEKNLEVRPEKDWELLKGRAVI